MRVASLEHLTTVRGKVRGVFRRVQLRSARGVLAMVLVSTFRWCQSLSSTLERGRQVALFLDADVVPLRIDGR